MGVHLDHGLEHLQHIIETSQSYVQIRTDSVRLLLPPLRTRNSGSAELRMSYSAPPENAYPWVR